MSAHKDSKFILAHELVPGSFCASSIVPGAAKAVKEANNKVLVLKGLTLLFWKAFFPQKTAGSMDK